MTLKTIYILRSQCDICELDKMEVFHTIKNARRNAMYKQLKQAVTEAFAYKHHCTHPIKFTEERDTKYKWDTKTQKAVEI